VLLDPNPYPVLECDDTEEEIMTSSVIEMAMSNRSLASVAGGERTNVRSIATRYARDIQVRVQEEAAIDAEDILTQAEEAGALDPVG
jgi:hypothetical protein